MSTHKRKHEEREIKTYITLGLLLLMVFVAASIWNNDNTVISAVTQQSGGFFDTIFGFIGGIIGTVFGLIGSIIGAVFGLIGQIIGLVFGIIGLVLGLVGTVIGLVFGFIGMIFGLVFGTLGLLISLIIPLAIIVLAVKLLGSNSTPQDKKPKRKREWNNDDIVDV